jgi:hypothetical protein
VADDATLTTRHFVCTYAREDELAYRFLNSHVNACESILNCSSLFIRWRPLERACVFILFCRIPSFLCVVRRGVPMCSLAPSPRPFKVSHMCEKTAQLMDV